MAAGARNEAAWPRVTVAVVAYNRREEVRLTLGKVLAGLDYPAAALEVILADNASPDGTGAMVREEFPSVKLLALDANIGAAAWNEAFKVGGGEWFLALDDDCWIEGDALKQAVATAEATGSDLVSFRSRSYERPDYFFDVEQYNPGVLGFWGCAWLISRRALDRVGGYDPYIFIWGNELELTLRLLDEGFKHLFLPQIVAIHMKRIDDGTTFNDHLHRTNFRHWSYVVAKLLRPLDAIRVFSRLVVVALIDVTRHPRAALTLPSMLRGFFDGLRRRRPVSRDISATYRDNFVVFANPLQFLRSPIERLRRDPSQVGRRNDRWRAERAEFYPVEPSAIRF